MTNEVLTPKVIVTINNKEIKLSLGQRISSFEYEELDDGDDKITIEIVDDYGQLIDHPLLQIRNKVKVQWGYVGNMSPTRTGILLEPEFEFQPAMTIISLSANDDGSKLHGRSDQKVHNHKSHSDIAREIAQKHGLKTNITDTQKIIETEPQGNKSDYEFLTYLASQNNYDFYIDVDTLHFHPQTKSRKPALIIDRKDKNSKFFISFRPEIKTQQEKAEATEVTAIGFDPIKREAVKHTANSESKQEGALGAKTLMINLDSGDTKFQKTETGHVQATPHSSLDQVEKEAETQRKRAEDNQIIADMTILGVPWLRAKQIIEVLGVGKKFSGKYYIKSIRHTISNGYRCMLNLTRDAVDEEITAKKQREVQGYESGHRDLLPEKDVLINHSLILKQGRFVYERKSNINIPGILQSFMPAWT